MSQASNTAGVVGRFGATSFTSVSTSRGTQGTRLPPRFPRPKFFKSRNLKDDENVIVEDQEEEERDQEEGESILSTNNESSNNIFRLTSIPYSQSLVLLFRILIMIKKHFSYVLRKPIIIF